MQKAEIKIGVMVAIERDVDNWQRRTGRVVGDIQMSDLVDVKLDDGPIICCFPPEMTLILEGDDAKRSDKLREAVRSAMKNQGMSRSALARKVNRLYGVSYTTAHRWLKGEGNATDKTINPMLIVLGLEIIDEQDKEI